MLTYRTEEEDGKSQIKSRILYWSWQENLSDSNGILYTIYVQKHLTLIPRLMTTIWIYLFLSTCPLG